ncbi:MAG: class III poly(R)-hydroxyalkanoic acid synthase subunit PhaE [Acidiferrobacterales bacterium]
MSENPYGSGGNDWMEIQRKYWEAWSELSRKALGNTPAPTPVNPWAQALDQWWTAVSPAASTEVEDFFSKLIEQGKAFFRLSENMSSALQSATPSGQSLSEWQQEIEQAFSGMKQAFSGSGADAPDVMRQVMAFWELPLDTWQRTASSMSVLPGDFLQNLKPEGLEGFKQKVEEGMERFLSIPGVGYTREWQEQLQAYGRLWLDYQKAHQHYVAAYARIGAQSVERLEQRVKRLLKEGKEVTTLRELYDLWVDCCEEVYGEYVATDEYAELHARLVNGLMKLKRHGSAMVDELLGGMSMPTRREINTLQFRLQEERRENKAMRAELESLKERVDKLDQGKPAQTQGRRTAKPASVRSKPSARTKKTKAGHVARQSTDQHAVKGG